MQTVIDETDYPDEPVPVSWAAAAGAQIAAILDVVHRHDVVHRDIKPSNLMLTSGGVVKVLDFGVAAGPRAALWPRKRAGVALPLLRGAVPDGASPRSYPPRRTARGYEEVAR